MHAHSNTGVGRCPELAVSVPNAAGPFWGLGGPAVLCWRLLTLCQVHVKQVGCRRDGLVRWCHMAHNLGLTVRCFILFLFQLRGGASVFVLGRRATRMHGLVGRRRQFAYLLGRGVLVAPRLSRSTSRLRFLHQSLRIQSLRIPLCLPHT
jgi:hypothetical protein